MPPPHDHNLSSSTLMHWFEEACDAHRWILTVHYFPGIPQPWEVGASHHLGRGSTLQSALADCWQQVARWAREQAARGTR